MTKQSTRAPLSAGLIMTKGSAMPSAAVASGPAVLPSAEVAKHADTQAPKSAFAYHKALTLKLDEVRYRKLKTAGLDFDMSSQDILVQALDAWLCEKCRCDAPLSIGSERAASAQGGEGASR